jgi:hypothetical protein
MLAHETSPVLGASVVEMTYGAYHGSSNMPAGVLGVPTASAREDQLCSKRRLHQQPAGDSTEENWSRAMKTKLPNGCLAKSRLAPTRAAGAQEGSDERHDHVQPISVQGPFPTIGSKAKGRAYASQMLVPGERYFIKRNCQSKARGSCQGRRRREAGSRPNRCPTCNQAPAYIRRPGPLVEGRSDLLLPPLARTARGAL